MPLWKTRKSPGDVAAESKELAGRFPDQVKPRRERRGRFQRGRYGTRRSRGQGIRQEQEKVKEAVR